MTEKDKRIINQELWLLVSQTMQASGHAMEILGRVSKSSASLKDVGIDITAAKRKVVE